MAKITILPPQKTPKQVTAHRGLPSLGEHKLAFLNANNRSGWLMDDIPEEPIAEHLAALFLIVVGNMPRPNEVVTQHPAPKRSKQVRSGIHLGQKKSLVKPVVQKQHDTIAEHAVETAVIPAGILRKYFVSARVNYSLMAICSSLTPPLNDAEYIGRGDVLRRQTPKEEYDELVRTGVFRTRMFDVTSKPNNQ